MLKHGISEVVLFIACCMMLTEASDFKSKGNSAVFLTDLSIS